jgi:hypothetical protein
MYKDSHARCVHPFPVVKVRKGGNEGDHTMDLTGPYSHSPSIALTQLSVVTVAVTCGQAHLDHDHGEEHPHLCSYWIRSRQHHPYVAHVWEYNHARCAHPFPVLTLSMIMGKNTPTSALSADLNFCSRLRKMEADSCSAAGMLLALFLSRDRHRYCRMAA